MVVLASCLSTSVTLRLRDGMQESSCMTVATGQLKSAAIASTPDPPRSIPARKRTNRYGRPWFADNFWTQELEQAVTHRIDQTKQEHHEKKEERGTWTTPVPLSSFAPLINRTADRVCGDRDSLEK